MWRVEAPWIHFRFTQAGWTLSRPLEGDLLVCAACLTRVNRVA